MVDLGVQLSEPLSGRISETNLTSMGHGMRIHLLKTVLGPNPEDTFESIQIDLSELPYPRSRQSNKQDKATADRLLGDTARLVLDLRELEVDLTIRPASTTADGEGSGTSVKEWMQASNTFASSDKVATDVPEAMLGMIGLVDSVAEAEKQNEAHLSQLLAILKPSRVKLTEICLAEDADVKMLSDPPGPAFIDPSRPLVYTGRMPTIIAGNNYFTKPNQVLNYLEIGPWIPVSDRCETEYKFVCSRWQIRVLAIRVAWPDKKLLKRSSSIPLPEILWDRTMGFSAMINGETGPTVSGSEESVKTRIVLILDRAKYAAKIADELDNLAYEEGKASALRGSTDTKSHLKAFKEMVYFVCPQASQEVKHIFSVCSKKKKKKDKADGAPKRAQADGGKVVDLPPLAPSPKSKLDEICTDGNVESSREHV
jgi:hypothetical protein